MKNGEVCEYVYILKKNMPKEYIADGLTREEYGQSVGGYFKANRGRLGETAQGVHILQADHFLRCPQLILFIAEIAGASSECIENAYGMLKQYEDNNNLRYSLKSGNYIWGKEVLNTFKAELKFKEIVKIIKEADNWDDVRKQVALIDWNSQIL